MMMVVVVMETMSIAASSHQGYHTPRTLSAKLHVYLRSPTYHPTSHTISDSTELRGKQLWVRPQRKRTPFLNSKSHSQS